MLSRDHTLVLPHTNGSSDPNCYCSCKDWQVDSPHRLTSMQLTILHHQHQLDILHTQLRRDLGLGGEKGDTVLLHGLPDDPEPNPMSTKTRKDLFQGHIKSVVYDKLYATHKFTNDECAKLATAITEAVLNVEV